MLWIVVGKWFAIKSHGNSASCNISIVYRLANPARIILAPACFSAVFAQFIGIECSFDRISDVHSWNSFQRSVGLVRIGFLDQPSLATFSDCDDLGVAAKYACIK